MATVHDLHLASLVELRTNVSAFGGALRERTQDVYFGDGLGGCKQRVDLRRNAFDDFTEEPLL